MAALIKIKRSLVNGNPAVLGDGELAYSAAAPGSGGGRLYIGIGAETAGDAAQHLVIGGSYFTDMLDHTPGVLTASSALITDADGKISELKVDSLNLNGSTVTTADSNSSLTLSTNFGTSSGSLTINSGANGNIVITPNGTGKTIITNIYTDATTSLEEYIQDVAGNTLVAGEGIDLLVDDAAGTTTISAELASYTNLGVAKFDTTGFVVTDGAVSLHGSVIQQITVDPVNETPQTVVTTDHGISILGGEGINVTAAGTVITVTGELATAGTLLTANPGVASFDSSSFAAESGHITIKTGGVSNTQLANSSLTIGSTTISLGGSVTTLSGLADPVNPQDAATKAYVDASRSGLDLKESVKAATTAALTATASGNNLTLTNAGTLAALVIDTVTMSVGDRVLVKDQTNKVHNGIYVVTTVGSGSVAWVLTRASDFDNTPGTEVTPGAFTFVEQGTANADSGWVLITDGVITIGTTELTFTQFSGTGQIEAGAALTKVGNRLDVVVNANGGIAIVNDALSLNSTVAGAGLTITNGIIDVVGTTNRIKVNADSIDISENYVGQSSITTVGELTSGSLGAGFTTVAVARGGTGATSFTAKGVLYGDGTNAIKVTAAGVWTPNEVGGTVGMGQLLSVNSDGVPTWTNVIDCGVY